MNGTPYRVLACLAVLPAIAPPPASAQASVTEYLRRVGFGAPQRDSVQRGHAVVGLRPGGAERDVAVLGAVALHEPPGAVRSRAFDVEGAVAAGGRRFHMIGDPATPADVRDAALDESEYQALRDCRPGSCDFKLPASTMAAFAEQVDWSAVDAKAQADGLMRAGLLRLASEYRARGNDATPRYDDARGVRSGDVFEELLREPPEIYEYAPELQRYLSVYPAAAPPGSRELLYWSEDRPPHLRAILTLNHVVAYTPGAGGTTFLARKQIYASHYFEGGFELLAVVEGGADTTYLITIRRFRFDNLPGGPANIRGRVRQQLLEATRAELRSLCTPNQPHEG